jgi:hypothetical protein
MYVKLYEQFNGGVSPDVLDQVKFGYPTQELAQEVDVDCPVKKWYIEKGFAEEFIRKAPKNSSKETRRDLEETLAKMQAVNSEDMIFARNAEESFEQMFIDFLQLKGIKTDMGEVQRVIGLVDPILYYLKDKVNRPRPHTLGWYHNVPILPLIHTDANSASYPGGHATSCYALSKYFGERHPHCAGEIENFAQRIADSRVQMGIHFPSDTISSKAIVDTLYKNGLINLR